VGFLDCASPCGAEYPKLLNRFRSSHHSSPPATSKMANHRADEKRFLDERGSAGVTTRNGLNPATIMEKPVRERIIDCYYWKAYCFGVNETDIINRVVEDVKFVGGTFGDAQTPSEFICLAFKLLQLAPSDEIIRLYLGYGGEKFKYLRALAAFYVRLTYKAKDVYEMLEPYMADYRKLRRKTREGGTALTYVDDFVDGLLTKDRLCSTTFWKMPPRLTLEDLDELEPRVSALGDIEALLESDAEEIPGDDQDNENRMEHDGRRSSESATPEPIGVRDEVSLVSK